MRGFSQFRRDHGFLSRAIGLATLRYRPRSAARYLGPSPCLFRDRDDARDCVVPKHGREDNKENGYTYARPSTKKIRRDDRDHVTGNEDNDKRPILSYARRRAADHGEQCAAATLLFSGL